MAGWIKTIERCRCECGWRATRQAPTTCPSCGRESVATDPRWRSYKAIWRNPAGVERSRSFRRKQDAEAHLETVGVSKRNGSYRDPSVGKVSLGDYLRARIETSQKLSDSTRASYRGQAERYIYPALGSVQLRAITTADLQAFVDSVRARTGARTTQIVYRIVSGTLAKAVREGLIPSNPAARLEVESPQERPIRLLTPEEVERVADAIDPRFSAMVLASAYGALRFGEVAGLRRRDLRLLDRPPKVLVHGTVIQVGGKVERVEHAKTKRSIRDVAIPSFLAEELARHLAAYPQPDDDGLVFRAPAGGPLARTVFRNRQWVPACERAGLAVAGRSPDGRRGWKVPPPRFHDLRHVGVTLAIKAGAHPLTISRWVGHTEIGTTMNVYGHLFPGAHEEMVAGLDELRAAAVSGVSEVAEVASIGG